MNVIFFVHVYVLWELWANSQYKTRISYLTNNNSRNNRIYEKNKNKQKQKKNSDRARDDEEHVADDDE